jgi:hypothetical protein
LDRRLGIDNGGIGPAVTESDTAVVVVSVMVPAVMVPAVMMPAVAAASMVARGERACHRRVRAGGFDGRAGALDGRDVALQGRHAFGGRGRCCDQGAGGRDGQQAGSGACLLSHVVSLSREMTRGL